MDRVETSTLIIACIASGLSRNSPASGIIGMMADAIITVIIIRVRAVSAMFLLILSVLLFVVGFFFGFGFLVLEVEVFEVLRVVGGIVLRAASGACVSRHRH